MMEMDSSKEQVEEYTRHKWVTSMMKRNRGVTGDLSPQSLNGPEREKTFTLTCARKEDSNKPAHPHSLIRIFVVRMKKICILGYPECVY